MANTPTINLRKPARADFVSVVNDINDNMDKIDNYAYTTNEAIANIGKRTVLSSGDFNTLTVTIGAENKYYYGSSIQSMTNAPTDTTGSWSLDVIDMNSYCVQQLTVYGVQAVHLYQRQQYWSGAKTWGPWQEFALKSDIPKIVTESITTDTNGRFNVSTYIGANKTLLGITNTGGGWCHFRLYSGSNGTTMCIVTDYDTNTPKPNTTVSLRMVYV